MTSMAFSASGDRRQKVSLRRRTTASSSTVTSAAADEALQHVLSRKAHKREGRPLPPQRAPALGSAVGGVSKSVNRLGLPQWLFRATVLGFVAVVMAFAVLAAVPSGGGRRGVAIAGSLKMNGRPLAQAALELHSSGQGEPFFVSVDTNELGVFRRAASAGIPVGAYAVVVKSGCIMASPQAEAGTPVKIPAKYRSVHSTPLKIEVAGEDSTFDLVLR